MNEPQVFARRPATIFNDFKYPLPATLKPVDGARFPATWNWEIAAKGNKIFMKVNDGVYGKDDPNAKLKEVELNFYERNSLLYVLEEAINNPDFTSSQIDIKRKLWNRAANKPNDVPTIQATFTVIRGKTGEIRVHYKRSTYEVTFAMTSEFLACRTRNENGEWVDNPGLASRAYTRAFVEFSKKFLDPEEWNRYEREQKGGNKPAGNGGGYPTGGHQQFGGQGGGQQQSQPQTPATQSFDEDFEF